MMSTQPAPMAHTPGPWSYRWETEARDWAIVTDANGSIVANVNTETGPDASSAPATRQMPAEANARLIAAAPDLLEALTSSLELLEHHYPKPARNGQIARARAAIAKATGGEA